MIQRQHFRRVLRAPPPVGHGGLESSGRRNSTFCCFFVRALNQVPVRRPAKIDAVTPVQLQQMARKYWDSAPLQIVAVGDATKIQAALAKKGSWKSTTRKDSG